MQSMYAQYMTGVTADFVLNIRKCPPLPGSSNSSSSGANSTQPAAHVLTEVKQRHPGIYRCVCVCRHVDRTCAQLAVQGNRKPALYVCCGANLPASCLALVRGTLHQRNRQTRHMWRVCPVHCRSTPCCAVLCSQLTERTSHQIQAIEPLGSAVLDALQEFNDYTPPQVVMMRGKRIRICVVFGGGERLHGCVRLLRLFKPPHNGIMRVT